MKLEELYGPDGFDAALEDAIARLSVGLGEKAPPRMIIPIGVERPLSSTHEGLEQVRASQVPMLARSLADQQAARERAVEDARPAFRNLARRAATQALGALARAGRPFTQRHDPPARDLLEPDRGLADMLAALARADSDRGEGTSSALERQLDRAAERPLRDLGPLLATMVALNRDQSSASELLLALGTSLRRESSR